MEKFKKHFYGRRKGRALSASLAEAYAQGIEAHALPVPFAPTGETHMEIGFGQGEHLLERAAQFPEIHFIGVEPFINGVARVVREICSRSLSNISLYTGDVHDLFAGFPAESLSKIYMLFPDPWPKKRHHGRRLFNQGTLQFFYRILVHSGTIDIATDHAGYLLSMQDVINAQILFDFESHPSPQTPVGWVETRYHRKAIKAGRIPQFFRIIKK